MGLAIALLTISDTRTLADDTSGNQLQCSRKPPTISYDGNYALMIATDPRGAEPLIADPEVDVVITSGTGLTGRDGTPKPWLLSWTKQSKARRTVSRAVVREHGTSTPQPLPRRRGESFVFVLPDPDAVTAWERLIRAQLDADTDPATWPTQSQIEGMSCIPQNGIGIVTAGVGMQAPTC